MLGIKDDATFEGKNIFLDVDVIKSKLNHLIQDRISPKLDVIIEFIPCREGNVLLIDIPKMEDIPYALVRKTDGGEIVARKYYIRTSNGKRYVTDRQLEALFKQSEIDFSYPFSFNLNFERDTFKILLFAKYLESASLFNYFFDQLKDIDIELIKSNNIEEILSLLTPYLLIGSFSKHFTSSWAINFMRKGLYKIRKDVPMTKIILQDLLSLPEDSVLNHLSKKFANLFDIWMFRDFFIPPKTKINLGKDSLIFDNDDFKISIYFHGISGGAGIADPQIAYDRGINYENQLKIQEDFFNIAKSGILNAEFYFPETNFELYREYVNFAKNIKKIIENEWDHETFLSTLPGRISYDMDVKLDKILEILSSSSNKKLKGKRGKK